MKTKMLLCSLFTFATIGLFAQETRPSNFNLSVGADITSSYMWRGIAQGTGPALQPWGEFSYKNLTFGTWASQELTGNFKEVDLYAKYTYKDFSLMFIDLFFPDYPGLNQDAYNFNNKTTGHAAELELIFNGTENLPFTVMGGVMVYGVAIDPKKSDATKLNNSTYFEVNYLGKLKDYSYNVFAGFTPSESALYYTSGFSVFNLGLSAKKSIKVTDSFSMPLKVTLGTNPAIQKTYVTFSLSL